MDTLSILHMIMIRAGRERASLDIRHGYPVSAALVDDRGSHAIALAAREVPRTAAVAEEHHDGLLSSFRAAYRREVRGIVSGEVRL